MVRNGSTATVGGDDHCRYGCGDQPPALRKPSFHSISNTRTGRAMFFIGGVPRSRNTTGSRFDNVFPDRGRDDDLPGLGSWCIGASDVDAVALKDSLSSWMTSLDVDADAKMAGRNRSRLFPTRCAGPLHSGSPTHRIHDNSRTPPALRRRQAPATRPPGAPIVRLQDLFLIEITSPIGEYSSSSVSQRGTLRTRPRRQMQRPP